jgi:MFS family permease
MAQAPETARSGIPGLAAAVLAAVLLVIAVLLFFALYLFLPQQNHFYALIAIGAAALGFALAAYLAQALSRDASAPRAVAWGFLGMGFTILIGTVAFAPNANLSNLERVVGLLVLFVFLAGVVVGVIWRADELAAESRRRRKREAWERRRPVSAFEYPAAQESLRGAAPVLASPAPSTEEPAREPPAHPPAASPPSGGP